jgi:hypothetical protein
VEAFFVNTDDLLATLSQRDLGVVSLFGHGLQGIVARGRVLTHRCPHPHYHAGQAALSTS